MDKEMTLDVPLTRNKILHLRYFNWGYGCCSHPEHIGGSPKVNVFNHDDNNKYTECEYLKSAFNKLMFAEEALSKLNMLDIARDSSPQVQE